MNFVRLAVENDTWAPVVRGISTVFDTSVLGKSVPSNETLFCDENWQFFLFFKRVTHARSAGTQQAMSEHSGSSWPRDGRRNKRDENSTQTFSTVSPSDEPDDVARRFRRQEAYFALLLLYR